jgi:hypothetical protein
LCDSQVAAGALPRAATRVHALRCTPSGITRRPAVTNRPRSARSAYPRPSRRARRAGTRRAGANPSDHGHRKPCRAARARSSAARRRRAGGRSPSLYRLRTHPAHGGAGAPVWKSVRPRPPHRLRALPHTPSRGSPGHGDRAPLRARPHRPSHRPRGVAFPDPMVAVHPAHRGSARLESAAAPHPARFRAFIASISAALRLETTRPVAF